jgi:hypothetical protein
MFGKDFIKKNKIQIIILTIIFIILFWYVYQNKKKEHMNGAAGLGMGAVLSACCIALCPCVISLVIMYYITKNAAKAAIKESSVSIQPLSNNKSDL